jgi:hypothetical protein
MLLMVIDISMRVKIFRKKICHFAGMRKEGANWSGFRGRRGLGSAFLTPRLAGKTPRGVCQRMIREALLVDRRTRRRFVSVNEQAYTFVRTHIGNAPSLSLEST